MVAVIDLSVTQSRQPSTESYIGSGGGSSNANIDTEFRQHLIVAVGSPLPTPSQPVGSQQGPVVLTAKNLQCMRAILSVAHCHGAVLGSAWHMVLTTLQVRMCFTDQVQSCSSNYPLLFFFTISIWLGFWD